LTVTSVSVVFRLTLAVRISLIWFRSDVENMNVRCLLHRTADLANYLAMTSRIPWTTGFKHLQNGMPFVAQSTSRRSLPPRSAPIPKSVAHPRDRIKFWNIIAGDKIGIFRGQHKPDADEKDRVFEVFDVDKIQNQVSIRHLFVS
jgi:hypothetical protein